MEKAPPRRDHCAGADPTEDIRALVTGIASGVSGCEHTFAERFMPPVRALLKARTNNSDAVPDLVQDVLITAICALRKGQLREPEKLASFVLGIARNTLNSHFRGQQRTALHDPVDEELRPLIAPEPQLEEQRLAVALAACERLEPTDRRILRMTLLLGKQPAVIARELKMSPEVVRQRKTRSLRKVIEIVRGPSQIASPSHLRLEGRSL
jgi:RNA polymerase sigma-70 factor (ECF subfamily)